MDKEGFDSVLAIVVAVAASFVARSIVRPSEVDFESRGLRVWRGGRGGELWQMRSKHVP